MGEGRLMLDITRLRLSEDEFARLPIKVVPDWNMVGEVFARSDVSVSEIIEENKAKARAIVADAQMAKCLWGIVEWLEAAPDDRNHPFVAVLELKRVLSQAGIPRPVEAAGPQGRV